MEIIVIDIINGRIILIRETPEALMAKSSNLSLRFPKVIKEARRIAKGRANGTIEAAA